MRTLIVTENVSLDGIASPLDWFDPQRSAADLLAASIEHRANADALLLGRTTFTEFAAFWPYQDDDRTGVRDYLNQVAKYVVSGTLTEPDWVNSTVLTGPLAQEVGALKAAEGKDIVVTGSLTLVRGLQRADLVDVYRMFVYPTVRGAGERLFPDDLRGEFDLTDCRGFDEGVVLLEYRRRD